jgi:pimeloyl-ACP methyl ester carboxylesterase
MTSSILSLGLYRIGEYDDQIFPRISTGSRYGVVYAHSAGSCVWQDQNAALVPSLLEACANANYPVHHGDLCGSAYVVPTGTYNRACYNYGNSDHVAAIGASFTQLQAMGAKTSKFYGLGASMGSLGMLNYAFANPTKVAAMHLFLPTFDLAALYSSVGSPANGYIATAYGVTYPTAISQANLNQYSPAVWGAAALSGIPIQIYASDNDTIGATTAQCQTWAAGQSNITVTSMGAIGHTVPLGFNPQTIVQFFDNNGGRN